MTQRKSGRQLEAEIVAALASTPVLIRIPDKAARAIEANASPYPRGARSVQMISDEIRALIASSPLIAGRSEFTPANEKRYAELSRERTAAVRAEDRARRERALVSKRAKAAERTAKAAERKATRKARGPETPEGTCQICGREHKIVRGKIALHGYQRPGDGHAHGRCYGAGYLPYEIDRDRLRWFITDVLRAQLKDTERTLARMSDPALTEITTHPFVGRVPGPPVVFRKGEKQQNSWGAMIDGFATARDHRIDECRRRISQLEREIAAQEKRLHA